jgi:hypothetical protein
VILAWTGTLLLAGALVFFTLAPRHFDPAGQRTSFFLVGRGVFAAVLRAGGHAVVFLAAGWMALTSAAVLAVSTSGYRWARRWQQFAIFAVGLLGTLAIVPVVVVLAIAAANLVIWAGVLALALAAVREVITSAFDQ